jgi:hypothetical protein
MTKYYDSKHFVYDSDKAIIASEESTYSKDYQKTYSCEFCRRTLTTLTDHSGQNVSWYCSFCNTSSYDTDNLRSEDHLEMSDGPIEEPAAALAPEPTLTRKKRTIKGALAEIAKRASVNILDYKEGKG